MQMFWQFVYKHKRHVIGNYSGINPLHDEHDDLRDDLNIKMTGSSYYFQRLQIRVL